MFAKWLLWLLTLLIGLAGAGQGAMRAPCAVEEEITETIVCYDMMMESAEAPMAPGMVGGMALWAAPTPAEDYAPLSDPGFASVRTSPLSTFAADVDTAAYANVRRMLLAQQPVAPDAVRVEELVNAFAYGDPAPTGDDPIAISAQVGVCPWNGTHQLLRVNLKTAAIETDALPPSNLVFLIDTSGSMDEPSKLPLVRRSFALLAGQLRPDDRVSIVTYAGSSHVVIDGARGDETARILAAIDELSAGGSTHGADGIETAYALAEKYARSGVNSRVILATDGDFNVGQQTQAELTRLIAQKREGGVFLTVLGFGYGNLKDTTLQALADHGNGHAAYIDSIHEARRALVDELGATLHTVAKDVKIQVEFNPDVVSRYRLIGYEARRMADEDFADDTKDGGELGASHSVTALYELIPVGADEASTPALTYQTATGTGSDDYATVRVRYKTPDGDTSTELAHTVTADAFSDAPNDDFILSAAVAAFGQLLAQSDYAGDTNQTKILDMLRPMLSGDTGGRIVELYTLVQRSEGL